MPLLDVIDRISEHKPQPFIAPLPNATTVEVFTVLDSIPYRFKLRDAEPGWWILRASKNKRSARTERPAYPYEYINYLEQLPRFYVIAVFRIAEKTWLCVPYNAGDAAQRGWLNGEPRQLHIVRDAVRPLDIVAARSLAGTLLYDNVSTRVTRSTTDLSTAENLLAQRREQIEAESRRKALEDKRKTLKGKLEHGLEFVGAELINYEDLGENLSVRWKYDGYEHTATVNRDTWAQSAGICLAGTDSQHNLTSLVLTIQEARKRHRPDMARESWI